MRSVFPLAIFLSACSQVAPLGDPPENEALAALPQEKNIVVNYVLEKPMAGAPRPTFHTARLAGDLALSGGCIGLTSAGRFIVLAFAPGEAQWDSARQRMIVDGVEYGIGMPIEVGGSTSGGPAVGGLDDQAPQSCRQAEIWYVAPGSLVQIKN